MDANSPRKEAATIGAPDAARGAPAAGCAEILYSRFPLTGGAADQGAPPNLDIVAPHVDAAFYRARYPDVARDGIDPAIHYLRAGWREGRNPNPWFDTLFYLQRYPDVAASGMNPLVHFIRHGRDDGREPHPPEADEEPKPQYANAELASVAEAMDLIFYRGVYRDIDLPDFDPVKHFHDAGWREGRKPGPWFDPAYYLRAYPDIAKAGMDPLLHYVRHGRREGRSPMAPGGQRRAVVDAAQAPAERPLGYDAPDPAPFLGATELGERIAAAVAGANGAVLSVSHDRYIDVVGGIELFIADEQSFFNGDRFAYVHVAPAVARLTLDAPAEQPATMQVVIDGEFAGLTTYAVLAEVLEAVPPAAPPVRVFTVHSIFGHRAADLAMLATKLRPTASCFWLHDYATLCEGYNLLRDDLEYCHAPPPASTACRVCVYGTHRAAYLEQVRALFEAVSFDVLAPSRAALDQWQRATQLPHRSAHVHAHGIFQVAPAEGIAAAAEPAALREPVRVAFVGYPLAHKGWPLFLDLFAAAHQLGPYTFYHFCSERSGQPMTGMISVPTQADRHDRSRMITALTEHGIELVVALSPWPETFSYVAYEAFAAGADVVTLACSGNIADAVRAHERGVVLRDAAALLRFFTGFDAARYAMAQRAAGRSPGRIVLTGTTATYDPEAGSGDAPPLTTSDPALAIMICGVPFSGERDGNCYRFDLPEGTEEVRLVSRFVPPVTLYAAADHRRAGAAISRVSLDGKEVPIRDPRRASGWHPPASSAMQWQWTDGNATLLTSGARQLEIVVELKLQYRRCPIGARRD